MNWCQFNAPSAASLWTTQTWRQSTCTLMNVSLSNWREKKRKNWAWSIRGRDTREPFDLVSILIIRKRSLCREPTPGVKSLLESVVTDLHLLKLYHHLHMLHLLQDKKWTLTLRRRKLSMPHSWLRLSSSAKPKESLTSSALTVIFDFFSGD